MRFPFRTFVNPALHEFDLLLREAATGSDGRHLYGLVLAADPLIEDACCAVTGNDQAMPVAHFKGAAILGIQPEIRDPGFCVRAMAGKAGVRKDRAN